MLPQFATQYTAALRYARVTPELEALVKASMENHEYLPRAVLADYLDEYPHYASTPDTAETLRQEETGPVHVELKDGKVHAHRYAVKRKQFEDEVESRLHKLGWLATDDEPTQMVAQANESLPFGWVRLYDDYNDYGYFPHHHLAAILDEIATRPNHEYGAVPDYFTSPHQEWPDDAVHSLEPVEEGTVNDSPYHVVKLHTNAGYKYVAGPHGVHDSVLHGVDGRLMRDTPESALGWSGFHSRDEDHDEDE